MEELKTNNLFDLNETIAKELLEKFEYPYEALTSINDFIIKRIKQLDPNEYDINDNIAISKTATIHKSAELNGPLIIGHNTEVRVNAFFRGKVIIGNNCVIGNSCELKNSIVFNGAKIPHFNYVGDSIIGYKSHLSAGVITANLKSDESNITIKYEDSKIDTGIKKIGAIVGDNSEVGCNSVLNPGTIIGKNSNVYPMSYVRTFIPSNHIFKDKDNIVPKK